MLDRLARRWAQGLTLGQIGEELGLTRGAVVGVIARAREHADDRFRPRPTAPRPKPPVKARRLKPVDEVVGNRMPPPGRGLVLWLNAVYADHLGRQGARPCAVRRRHHRGRWQGGQEGAGRRCQRRVAEGRGVRPSGTATGCGSARTTRAIVGRHHAGATPPSPRSSRRRSANEFRTRHVTKARYKPGPRRKPSTTPGR